MRKLVFLLLFLLLSPMVSAKVRITKTALVDDEFFVGLNAKEDFRKGSISIFFPDTDERFISPVFNLLEGDTTIKHISVSNLDTLYARVTISNDYSHRTRYYVLSIIK